MNLVRFTPAGILIVTGAPSNAYAITKSKCMIRIVHRAPDGANGIIFFCQKDRIDLDRIVTKLNKKVYETWDATRPYKVVIEPDELSIVADILLKNEDNTI